MPSRHSARPLALALALALLGGTASAGELDLRVQAGDRPARAMTWLEVTAGPVPALRFRADDGTPHRLEVDVEQMGDDKVRLAVRISGIEVKRNGTERVRLITDELEQEHSARTKRARMLRSVAKEVVDDLLGRVVVPNLARRQEQAGRRKIARSVLQVHHGRAVFPTLLRLKTRPFYPDRFGTSIA